MRITIIAFGTRGDVQPLLALGRRLRGCGHQVRVLASAHFRAWIERHGLEAAEAQIDIHVLMQSEGGRDWVKHGNNGLRQARIIRRLLNEHGMTMIHDAWAACQDAEVVLSSFTSDTFAASIAERLGALHISTPLQPPLIATRSGAAMSAAPLPGRASLLNYLVGRLLLEPFAWQVGGALTNRFRRETLGLEPQTLREYREHMRRTLAVLGYSRLVVPHPPDWPATVHTTGYWFLDDEDRWAPPPDLLAFLEAGPPPVYIGFGSMTGHDVRALTQLLINAIVRSGRRAILQSGWARLGDERLPAQVYLLDAAPHSWLFPRMRAVIHHGGAGTTAEGLRAGRPTVVIPHMADQPFWGARVAALGVGPQPIPRNRLTADSLAVSIRRVFEDGDMQQRAAALGAQIRAEDGIGTAVGLITAHLTERFT